MDKIFERNIIAQDSMLCKISTDTLQKISKFLSPTNVVNLSHTCKELHQRLPFYLIKSGEFTGTILEDANFRRALFEGPAIHFFVSEVNISLDYDEEELYAFWVQIIRGGKVILETHHCWSKSIQFTKKSLVLTEYKPGDRIWFMFCSPHQVFNLKHVPSLDVHINYEVSLQLENYEYGKPMYYSRERRGYAEFTSTSILMKLSKDFAGNSVAG